MRAQSRSVPKHGKKTSDSVRVRSSTPRPVRASAGENLRTTWEQLRPNTEDNRGVKPQDTGTRSRSLLLAVTVAWRRDDEGTDCAEVVMGKRGEGYGSEDHFLRYRSERAGTVPRAFDAR
jgi:hypothetical protein